ncbi:uncharacterized protein OCT59_004604 [Rhizophagus irregularis]|uniref:uncharacterized protein n=1 Tax=Rhizophagus irregularis TaxID=588596 RepID=UPI00333122B6|nr:hypothetical protein OCT59_004604 [Rhizophagus irregularis]
MDEIKLTDDVFEQIKEFNRYDLTEKQKSLIDKLITNEELKERYKKNGLCKNCKQPKTTYSYLQLNAKNENQIIEWIEYDKFEDVEYLAKGGFGTTFKAVWKDGPWKINYDNNQMERKGETKVALKCLHNSQDITADFLKEVESNILACESYDSHFVVRCFGITKDPKTNNFMMVMDLKEDPLKRPKADELGNLFTKLWSHCDKSDSLIREQAKEADEINKKSSSTVKSPLSSTSTLSYITHPQAVYTSRLLDFKNLPEPKNSNNDDLEYSDSLRMNFTKLDINSKDESS